MSSIRKKILKMIKMKQQHPNQIQIKLSNIQRNIIDNNLLIINEYLSIIDHLNLIKTCRSLFLLLENKLPHCKKLSIRTPGDMIIIKNKNNNDIVLPKYKLNQINCVDNLFLSSRLHKYPKYINKLNFLKNLEHIKLDGCFNNMSEIFKYLPNIKKCSINFTFKKENDIPNNHSYSDILSDITGIKRWELSKIVHYLSQITELHVDNIDMFNVNNITKCM